jgi:hypothetical protein
VWSEVANELLRESLVDCRAFWTGAVAVKSYLGVCGELRGCGLDERKSLPPDCHV